MLDSCGSKCLKYFLAIFNFLFFAGGLALAGISGYEAFNKNSMLNKMIVSLDAPVLKDGLYILMAVGLMLAMISFFGCWGALSENKCLLVSYFVFILVIFILQLAGIIISLVKYKQIKSVMISDLKMKNPNNIAKLYGTALGLVETKFHCCGITGPGNYAVIPPTCYAPAPSRARRAADAAVPTEAALSGTSVSITTSATASAGGVSSTEAATSAASATQPSATRSASASASPTTLNTVSSAASSTQAHVVSYSTSAISSTAASETLPPIATSALPVVTTHKATTKAPTTTESAVPMVLYEQGCETAIRPYLYAAGGIAIGILLLEILVMLFACCLITAIKKGYTPV